MRLQLFWLVSLAFTLTVACGQPGADGEAQTTAAAPAAESPASGEAAEAAEAAVEAPKPAVEVVLWHAYRAAEKVALEEVVAGINDSSTSVKIRAQAVPYDPFVDKVTITIPRGQGPDLFIFAHNMIGAWAEEELLESLSKAVDSETLRWFLPETVTPLVHEGNLYGLPLAFKSLVLFHNKKLLPEVPVSMDLLVPKLVEIQKANPGVHGLVAEAGLLYNHAPWMHAFGGVVFDEGGQPALDSEGQRRAAAWVRSLHKEHKVLPSGMTGFMVSSLFNEGKAAVALNGPWFRAELSESLDVGVAVIPSLEGRFSKPFLGVEAVFVSRQSKNKEAAIEAARLLAGASSAKVRMEKGKQPVAHRETLEAGAKADPMLGVFLEQAATAVPMSARPEMQLVWSTMDMALQGIVYGEKKPDAALKSAQDKVKADISKRGR